MIDNEKTIAAALQEMKRLESAGGRVALDMPIPDLLIVVAHVQLALRHPRKTVSSVRARELCDGIIGSIERLSPELAAFMRLGYNEKYDVPEVAAP